MEHHLLFSRSIRLYSAFISAPRELRLEWCIVYLISASFNRKPLDPHKFLTPCRRSLCGTKDPGSVPPCDTKLDNLTYHPGRLVALPGTATTPRRPEHPMSPRRKHRQPSGNTTPRTLRKQSGDADSKPVPTDEVLHIWQTPLPQPKVRASAPAPPPDITTPTSDLIPNTGTLVSVKNEGLGDESDYNVDPVWNGTRQMYDTHQGWTTFPRD